jgi:hypothetical protein
MDFQRSDNLQADSLSGVEITELRREHAELLLEGKRFIFGSYVVTPDDTVCPFSFSQGLLYLCYSLVRSVNRNHIKAVFFYEHSHPLSGTLRM